MVKYINEILLIILNKTIIIILEINGFNEKNNLSLPKLETSNGKYQNEIKEALLKNGQNDFNKILKSFPVERRNMVSCLKIWCLSNIIQL